MMTKQEAWKVVEIVFSVRTGMCNTIDKLWAAKLISPQTHRVMKKQIDRAQAHRGQVNFRYLFPCVHVDYDENRMQFARRRAKGK